MRTPIIALTFLLLNAGCTPSVETSLKLEYPPPTIPSGLDTAFKPQPGDWANNLLRPGETTINFEERYANSHKYGWKMAISEWDTQKTFQYNCRDDFNVWQDVKSSVDGLWEGYNAARTQILEKSNSKH
jgi:hypothetical protein